MDWRIEPGDVKAVVVGLAMSVTAFAGSNHLADQRTEAVKWEAKDALYVERCKIDSLVTETNAIKRELKKLKRAAKIRDKYDPVTLTYLGPPAPAKRGFFGRIIHFLKSEGE